MPIHIDDRRSSCRPPAEKIRRILSRAMRHLGCARDELSVLLVTDREMRSLNRTHRGKNRPTDILSFGMRERRGRRDPLPPHPGVLGDLVVSTDSVARLAAGRNADADAALAETLVHGLLHLLGYGHAGSLEAERMYALQAALAAQCQTPPRRRGRVSSR